MQIKYTLAKILTTTVYAFQCRTANQYLIFKVLRIPIKCFNIEEYIMNAEVVIFRKKKQKKTEVSLLKI